MDQHITSEWDKSREHIESALEFDMQSDASSHSSSFGLAVTSPLNDIENHSSSSTTTYDKYSECRSVDYTLQDKEQNSSKNEASVSSQDQMTQDFNYYSSNDILISESSHLQNSKKRFTRDIETDFESENTKRIKTEETSDETIVDTTITSSIDYKCMIDNVDGMDQKKVDHKLDQNEQIVPKVFVTDSSVSTVQSDSISSKPTNGLQYDQEIKQVDQKQPPKRVPLPAPFVPLSVVTRTRALLSERGSEVKVPENSTSIPRYMPKNLIRTIEIPTWRIVETYEAEENLREKYQKLNNNIVKLEVKSEMKEEVQSEVQLEVKSEMKEEVKSELKEEAQLEVKSEMKEEVQLEVKLELKEEQTKQNNPSNCDSINSHVSDDQLILLKSIEKEFFELIKPLKEALVESQISDQMSIDDSCDEKTDDITLAFRHYHREIEERLGWDIGPGVHKFKPSDKDMTDEEFRNSSLFESYQNSEHVGKLLPVSLWAQNMVVEKRRKPIKPETPKNNKATTRQQTSKNSPKSSQSPNTQSRPHAKAPRVLVNQLSTQPASSFTASLDPMRTSLIAPKPNQTLSNAIPNLSKMNSLAPTLSRDPRFPSQRPYTINGSSTPIVSYPTSIIQKNSAITLAPCKSVPSSNTYNTQSSSPAISRTGLILKLKPPIAKSTSSTPPVIRLLSKSTNSSNVNRI